MTGRAALRRGDRRSWPECAMTERRVSLPRARGKPAAMSTAPSRPLAVVTGASSGIGLELAKQFASNGYDLLVAAEDAELAGAARELEGLGAHVEAVQVDLATEPGVEQLERRIEAAGRPGDAGAPHPRVGAGGGVAHRPSPAGEPRVGG